MTVSDADLSLFQEARPRLFAIAYRLLGSANDAEDVVQEAFVRWQTADRNLIEVPTAWLTKVVTNVGLNRLTSAAQQREEYVGVWLPEPILDVDPYSNPEAYAQQQESVSYALLVLLERLSPVERAVFVLREAFNYRHAQIADFLGVSESASQQALHRAKEHIGSEPRYAVESHEAHRVVRAFVDASMSGDPEKLAELLTVDAIAVGDGGGIVPASTRAFRGGAKVATFLTQLFKSAPKMPQYTAGLRLYSVVVGGDPALLGVNDERLIMLLVLEVREGAIAAIRNVANPNKLTYAYAQWKAHPDGHPLPYSW